MRHIRACPALAAGSCLVILFSKTQNTKVHKRKLPGPAAAHDFCKEIAVGEAIAHPAALVIRLENLQGEAAPWPEGRAPEELGRPARRLCFSTSAFPVTPAPVGASMNAAGASQPDKNKWPRQDKKGAVPGCGTAQV
jgi:hypothetical protein